MRLIAQDGSRACQPLSQYAAQARAEDWQEVIWPSEQVLTCGHVRRRIQEEHRRNLSYWLLAQFQAGRTVDDIDIQLAISSS
jgi:hypothetical protein